MPIRANNDRLRQMIIGLLPANVYIVHCNDGKFIA